MLKYLNGKIINNALPNETCLLIKISRDDSGQALTPMFPEILKDYSRYITAICFIGGEDDPFELIELIKQTKKHGLKTCLSTPVRDEAKINPNLSELLDFIQLGNKTYRKEYSPLDDADVWIDV